jgi:serine/threonine-protein kinase RsbW
MNRIEHNYELSPVLDKGIAQLHAALVDFWANTSVAPETQIRFSIALAEVVANILQYAVVPGDAPIKLCLRCTPTGLEARLVDKGRSWTMPTTGFTLPADRAERGRGLAIANAVLDTLQYRRFRDLNCWRLVLLHRAD